MPVNDKWITCVHCGSESLASTLLVEKGCCFSCYMKGLSPLGDWPV